MKKPNPLRKRNAEARALERAEFKQRVIPDKRANRQLEFYKLAARQAGYEIDE